MNYYFQTYLQESYPSNPGDIVLKNKFYPRGLREIDIYNYYMAAKRDILQWIRYRSIAIFLRIDNETVVRRKINEDEIKLTPSNYENLITGRTLSLYVERKDPTNYFVVDIDGGRSVKYSDILKAAKTAKELLEPFEVRNWEMLFTSPHGLHLIGHLSKAYPIELMPKLLESFLSKQNKYLVNVKGERSKKGVINYDLSPNYRRALHMARYSLTKEGLVCNDISKGLRIQKVKRV